MIDEDEPDEVEEGLVDLAMRGWRTLDEHPLIPLQTRAARTQRAEVLVDPVHPRVQWKLDVSQQQVRRRPTATGQPQVRILVVLIITRRGRPKARSANVFFWRSFVGAEHNSLVTVPGVVGFRR